MPRDLPLANGHMLVNFDAQYNLRDIYWPHVGERNQTQGHVNHTGVWVDGSFAWFDSDVWQRELRYDEDTLVTSVTLTSDALQLTIACHDTVDFDRDLFIRRLEVTNRADRPREVRLFFHHDWHLGESEGANTVLYAPELQALAGRLTQACTPGRQATRISTGSKAPGATPKMVSSAAIQSRRGRSIAASSSHSARSPRSRLVCVISGSPSAQTTPPYTSSAKWCWSAGQRASSGVRTTIGTCGSIPNR